MDNFIKVDRDTYNNFIRWCYKYIDKFSLTGSAVAGIESGNNKEGHRVCLRTLEYSEDCEVRSKELMRFYETHEDERYRNEVTFDVTKEELIELGNTGKCESFNKKVKESINCNKKKINIDIINRKVKVTDMDIYE